MVILNAVARLGVHDALETSTASATIGSVRLVAIDDRDDQAMPRRVQGLGPLQSCIYPSRMKLRVRLLRGKVIFDTKSIVNAKFHTLWVYIASGL